MEAACGNGGPQDGYPPRSTCRRGPPLRKQPCAMPNLVPRRRPGVSRPLGCSAVRADQAADDLPALDPGGAIDGVAPGRATRLESCGSPGESCGSSGAASTAPSAPPAAYLG